MSLPRAHFGHNPKALPHLFHCGIPIQVFMKVFEAKEGQEDTFVKCLLDWSRVQGHPQQQVLEARVVTEEKNEGGKINFVRLASGSSYEYARL